MTAIRGFLQRTAPAAAAGPFDAETGLLAAGLLDSLAMLQLTTFLADELGVEFEDDDFTAENFATVGSLGALVAAKRRALLQQ